MSFLGLKYTNCCVSGFEAGLAILTINSTKNHETFGSKVGVYLVFYVTEEGWVRRGGKGEGGCGEIFL